MKNIRLVQEKEINKLRLDRKKYLFSPSAGSGIMKFYSHYYCLATKGKKKVNSLVLGVTPELRDLVLSFGHNLTTIDFNTEAILNMAKIMRYANSEKEIIVKADWLKNPLKSNFYDVVLGDGVFFIVDPKKQYDFLRKIYQLLKKDGFIILREPVINLKSKVKTIKQIDQDYLKKRIHWFDLFCGLIFSSDVSFKWFNQKKEIFDYGKFFKEIYKFYKNNILSRKSFHKIWWFKHEGIHRIMRKDNFEKFLNKFFHLFLTQQAKDFEFTKDTMIFFFGKVKK